VACRTLRVAIRHFVTLTTMALRNAFIGILGIFVCYYLLKKLLSRLRHARMIRQNGCLPPRQLVQQRWLNGFDMPLNFSQWIKDHAFLERTAQLLRENGRTFSLRYAGNTVIWTAEAENIKAMLATKFEDFELSSVRCKAFAPFVGDSIFAANGTTWAHGRALLRPSFSRAQVADLGIYEKNFQHLVQRIPNDGSVVDLDPLFRYFTMDTAAEFFFGESTYCLLPEASERSKGLAQAFDYASAGVFQRLHMGQLIWFHHDKKFRDSCKIVHDFVEFFVENALKSRNSQIENKVPSKKGYIFIDELAKDTTDRKVLRDQLVGALAAGRDTTATLMSLTVWLLAKHPRVLERLRTAIKAFDGAPPSYEQIKNLEYLRWVFSESESLSLAENPCTLNH
jgi:cytochrome P450